MIVTESYGENLVRTYSDAGLKIVNPQGEVYEEAIDPAGLGRTYTETEELVEGYEEATESDYIDALKEAGII